MAYKSNKPPHELLLKSTRDDYRRALAFDSAYANFTDEQKAKCDKLIKGLCANGINEVEAKAMVAELLIFVNMKPDDQDCWIQHGKAVLSRYEWHLIDEKHRATRMAELDAA